MDDKWQIVRIYCVNCGTVLSSVKDKNGLAKFHCNKCGCSLVSSIKVPKNNSSDGNRTIHISVKTV